MSKAAATLWQEFCTARGALPGEPYQSWYFGNTPAMALDLAKLVMSGKKTATASLEAVNDVMPEQRPINLGYSVVTDFEGAAMCVIQTAEICFLPFHEVDARFAADEGEGDQTLEYWRGVHWRYFTREAAGMGLDFDENSIICCERFALLYPV